MMSRIILNNFFYVQMCLFVIISGSLCHLVEFTKHTNNVTEYLLLAGKTPLTLQCIQHEGETVNILQRNSNDKGIENRIVNNSTLNTTFREEYEYTYSLSNGTNSHHNLTIRSLSNTFDGYIYNCVSRPSGIELTLMLKVADLPHCEFNFQYPIFFKEDVGKSFQMTCELKANPSFVGVNIENPLISGQLEVMKTHNDTHKTASLSMVIDQSWNTSEFYCRISLEQENRSGIAEPRAASERACHFGPILFYEKLQVSKSLEPKLTTYFNEGDTVSFTCKSNVRVASKKWEVNTYPKEILQIDRKEIEDTLSLHIRSAKKKIQTVRIEALCIITFRGKETIKKFEAVFRSRNNNDFYTESRAGLVVIALFAVFCTTLLFVCLSKHRG